MMNFCASIPRSRVFMRTVFAPTRFILYMDLQPPPDVISVMVL